MPEPQQQLEEMVAWELCRTHLCVWEMEKGERVRMTWDCVPEHCDVCELETGGDDCNDVCILPLIQERKE